jgi:hypothetical protein
MVTPLRPWVVSIYLRSTSVAPLVFNSPLRVSICALLKINWVNRYRIPKQSYLTEINDETCSKPLHCKRGCEEIATPIQQCLAKLSFTTLTWRLAMTKEVKFAFMCGERKLPNAIITGRLCRLASQLVDRRLVVRGFFDPRKLLGNRPPSSC